MVSYNGGKYMNNEEDLIDFLGFISIVPVIKESELMAQKPKTFNFMRLRELLLQNSTNANLIVM
jgi:hypothetical protein